MKAVFIEVPQSILDERQRLGLDKRDEMWDGVLHVVPPPGGPHQRLGSRFLVAVHPVAAAKGFEALYEPGLYRASDDYRVPDLAVISPESLSDRGIERAELVVEIRSPRDETYAKIGFYAAMGVREMIILHPHDGRIELLRNVEGALMPTQPGAEGTFESEVLGITLQSVAGKLRITWAEGSAEI